MTKNCLVAPHPHKLTNGEGVKVTLVFTWLTLCTSTVFPAPLFCFLLFRVFFFLFYTPKFLPGKFHLNPAWGTR